jgi:hypothetical protein
VSHLRQALDTLTRLAPFQNPAAPEAAVACTHTLPNVGNEGHTYLWHITKHWDSLPDLMVLLPDTVEYGDKLKTWRRVKARPLCPSCTCACASAELRRRTHPRSATWRCTASRSTMLTTTRPSLASSSF